MADLCYKNIENQREEVDYFDLLPDPILHLIFNKLFDAKTLCCCLLVSKRCASLVSQVDSISIHKNHKNNSSNNSSNTNSLTKTKKSVDDSAKTSSGSSKGFLKNPIFKFICKPVYLLQQAIANKKTNSSSKNGCQFDLLTWVGNILNNFQEIQSVKLEIPCNCGVNEYPLLKWEAEFGKEMEKCAILGATSTCEKKEKLGLEIEGGGENEMQIFIDEELKMRRIWIIYCLNLSSAWHYYLMKKMVGQCQKLSNAVISDSGKQGKLSMNSPQIKDLRDSIKNSNTSNGKIENNPSLELQSEGSNEVVVDDSTTATSMDYAGNVVMKPWYVKELELPNCGKVMKGATLFVIKPEKKENSSSEKKENNEGDLLSMFKAFEGEEVFEEAAKELLKRKEKGMYRYEIKDGNLVRI